MFMNNTNTLRKHLINHDILTLHWVRWSEAKNDNHLNKASTIDAIEFNIANKFFSSLTNEITYVDHVIILDEFDKVFRLS